MIGLVGILISAKLIVGSSEYMVHMLDLHIVIAATLIGMAGSIPEHGLALIGANKAMWRWVSRTCCRASSRA